MKRPGRLLLAFALAFACSGKPGTAQPALTEMSFGTLGVAMSQWPIYIAQERGYFKDAGLHVTQVIIGTVPAVVTTAATRGVDVASIGTDSLIAAVQNHLPVKAVVPAMTTNPYSLVVSPSIKTFADLKGKTVVLGTKQDVTALALRAMCAAQHLDFDRDLSFVVTGATAARLAALTSGNVQGAMLSPPFDLAAEAQGMRILANAADYEKHWLYTVYISNTDWAATHRSELVAFARALRRAIDYGYTHRKESVDALITYSHVEPAAAEKTYDNAFVKWHAFDRQQRIDEVDLRAVEDAMIAVGTLAAPLPLSAVYDPSFTREGEK